MKRILLILICLFVIFSLTSCNNKNNETKIDQSLQNVLDKGELILGLDMGFPPMGYTDENGQIVGFDIDLAKEVCKRLGVELVLQGIDWDKKEEYLNDGSIDCIWNGFSITDSRKESMCLSDPYMNNAILFMVKGTSSIKSIDDLDGVTIGVQAGSTAEELLTKADFYSKVSVKRYESAQEVLKELSNDNVDTILIDSVCVYYFIYSTDDLYYILSDSFGEEQYAVAFKKGNNKLCDKIEEILGEMKEDGTIDTISTNWFGSDITIVK